MIVEACRPETLAHAQDCQLVLAVQDATELNHSGLRATEGLGCSASASKLGEVVRSQPDLGRHEVEVPRGDGRASRRAKLTLRVASVLVRPPANAKLTSAADKR